MVLRHLDVSTVAKVSVIFYLLVLIIIVVIMGGLGSISGCLYASVLVGLLSNYTTYIVPQVSLFSSIGLMVAVLLLWPRGLVPVR